MEDRDFPDGDRDEYAERARQMLADGEEITGKELMALGTPIDEWELDCTWCEAKFTIEADAGKFEVYFCPACGFGAMEKRWDYVEEP